MNTKIKNVVKNNTTTKQKSVVNKVVTTTNANDLQKLSIDLQKRVYENKLIVNIAKIDKLLKREYNMLLQDLKDSVKISNAQNQTIKFTQDNLQDTIAMFNNLYKSHKITFNNMTFSTLKVAFMSATNGRLKVSTRGVKTSGQNDYNLTLSPFVLALQQKRFGVAIKPL